MIVGSDSVRRGRIRPSCSLHPRPLIPRSTRQDLRLVAGTSR